MISKTTPNQECMYDFNFFVCFAFRVGSTPILYIDMMEGIVR